LTLKPLGTQAVLFNLNEASLGLPHIYGKTENSEYLYVTAGERLYCIGNQMDKFPQIGFHVSGQMGGIWMHPVKLFDGFDLSIADRMDTLVQSERGQ
jgi:hypothetical protein